MGDIFHCLQDNVIANNEIRNQINNKENKSIYILQFSHVFQDKENREYRKGYKNTRQRFFLFVGHCFNLPFVYV